jgi:glutaredoxin-like protein NrdH
MTDGIKQKVVVYSTPLCSPCDGLKNYLTSINVSFSTKDLMMDEEAAEMIENKGIRSTPVLQIDDDFYFGADLQKERLEKILNR